MKPMVTVKQAVVLTGLSEWELKRGIRAGEYPYIRIGEGKGKFYFNIDLLDEAIRQKMLANVAAKTTNDQNNIVSLGNIRRIAE